MKIRNKKDLIKFLNKYVKLISPYKLPKDIFECVITDEMYTKIMRKYSQVSKKKVKMDGGGKTKRKRKKYLKKTRKKQRGGLIDELVFMTGIFTLLSIAMCCVAAPFLMALQCADYTINTGVLRPFGVLTKKDLEDIDKDKNLINATKRKMEKILIDRSSGEKVADVNWNDTEQDWELTPIRNPPTETDMTLIRAASNIGLFMNDSEGDIAATEKNIVLGSGRWNNEDAGETVENLSREGEMEREVERIHMGQGTGPTRSILPSSLRRRRSKTPKHH